MDPYIELQLLQTRRQFLSRGARGIGTLALASLLNPAVRVLGAGDDGSLGVINPLHFPRKTKRRRESA